ncbi:extracellular solute-binding protein [Umezawaea tangerina]|uniref:Carbohydrate ABC transporter substrate-binding protein (CUT1 family) n=1 Tax=Umezawaea tangerina TaxID=84725 RepID=A0A2T0SUY8_9PSEU|nr:extracellular solute-binding protein [Umezawaea tangerina]PRY37229.1 carbohydrate ABC transporter substrate-binding protein (CUT1 family) [Umezawaea tangerina]
MNVNRGQWSPRFRVLVILVMVGVVVAITSASTLLIAELTPRWSAASVLSAVVCGLLAVISGICVNVLPWAIRMVWTKPEQLGDFVDLVAKLGRALRRPLKQAGIVLVVAAIVAAGVFVRPPATELEPGPLVVMTAFGESKNDPRSILLDLWNQSHPANQAEFDYVSGEPSKQNERMGNDAKQDGEHHADAYALDIPWLPQFAMAGHIRPLDRTDLPDSALGDFIPKVLATGKFDDKLWGLPLNSDVGMIYCRTDLPGVAKPKTWDDYFGAAAKQLAVALKTSGPGVEAANAAQLADEMLNATAVEAMWAAGGEVVSRTGRVVLTADESEVAFEPEDRKGIEDLARAVKDADIVLAGADSMTEASAITAFKSGKTAYMRNWPVSADDLEGKVEFTPSAPPTPSILGGQTLAVSKWTTRPRATQALIEFMTSSSSELILSEVGGFVPTRNSAFDSSKRLDKQELRKALEDARLRPVTPYYPKVSRVFHDGIARALNNGGKLEEDFPRELATALKGG